MPPQENFEIRLPEMQSPALYTLLEDSQFVINLVEYFSIFFKYLIFDKTYNYQKPMFESNNCSIHVGKWIRSISTVIICKYVSLTNSNGINVLLVSYTAYSHVQLKIQHYETLIV